MTSSYSKNRIFREAEVAWRRHCSWFFSEVFAFRLLDGPVARVEKWMVVGVSILERRGKIMIINVTIGHLKFLLL